MLFQNIRFDQHVTQMMYYYLINTQMMYYYLINIVRYFRKHLPLVDNNTPFLVRRNHFLFSYSLSRYWTAGGYAIQAIVLIEYVLY